MRKRQGFTLIELVIVILIIGILAVVLVPQLSSMVNKAKRAGVLQDFREFQTAAQTIAYEDSGFNADTVVTRLNQNLDAQNQLEEAAQFTRTKSATVISKNTDPWGTNYTMEFIPATDKSGDIVKFICNGPDKDIATLNDNMDTAVEYTLNGSIVVHKADENTPSDSGSGEGEDGGDAVTPEKPHAKAGPYSKTRLDSVAQNLTGTLKFVTTAYSGDLGQPNVYDVSEARDNSIICVVSGQDATVYGDGGVKAPDNNLFESYRATILDLNGLDTSEVRCMSGMFSGAKATEIKGLNKLDTSKVQYMGRMFANSEATSLDLSSFDTSQVIEMKGMFSDSRATSINLSSFDTSNVTDMSYMFRTCQAPNLDLSSFDTSNVTNMGWMFYACKATSINLSSFNTRNVTSMTNMFSDSRATSINLSSFDTSNVTDMSSMFSYSEATSLDLSSFDTSNVTNMNGMFVCAKATTVLCRTQADLEKMQNSGIYDATGFKVK